MKKLLFFFSALFILRSAALAQTNVYHPFPESGAVWNVDYYLWSGVCEWEQRYSYLFAGDTIINAINYHKLWTPYVQTVFNFSTCSPYNTAGYKGCIRQDTTLRKVFIVAPSDSVEQLLYDFNLQVNDSLKGFLSGILNPNPPVIINVDSVLINTDYRKRWTWQWWVGDTAFFIEGIGSSLGLIENVFKNFDAPTTSLLCFQQNGQTLYPDNNSACDIIDALKNIPEEKIAVTLSPNPFHSSATFYFNLKPEISNLKLKVYNTHGALVLQSSFSNLQSVTISREHLPDGLYYYELRTNNYELTANGKFVIE